MKDAYVTYTIVNGIYHIEMKIDGEFICGGITGVKDYENAYSFASRIAKNHNARLAWFKKESKDLIKLDKAIKDWTEVAEYADRMAEMEIARGSSPNAFINQADVARRTVKAFEIQKETGIPVCSCCFKPFGKGNKILIRN